MNWLEMDGQGLVQAQRVVAVAPYESAPIRRMVGGLPAELVIVLTSGKRRSSVLILDSGHVVIAAQTVAELERRLVRLVQRNGWSGGIRPSRPSGG